MSGDKPLSASGTSVEEQLHRLGRQHVGSVHSHMLRITPPKVPRVDRRLRAIYEANLVGSERLFQPLHDKRMPNLLDRTVDEPMSIFCSVSRRD